MKKETYIRKASEALANIMTDIERKGVKDKNVINRIFQSYKDEFFYLLSDKDFNFTPTKVSRKVNLVELCCQLGEIPTEMEAKMNKEKTSYYDREEETYKYNDDYQDIFNNYYDQFWGMLEERGYENDNS